ncbi:hypothetical protein AB0I28_01160 [Phytomonospora sp. NPDC050363]|uniref:hypothetical protein n=1 Tax=Phytomonospora sp. NPDC050363 TaxID=3155642 RepID=UPI003402AF6C
MARRILIDRGRWIVVERWRGDGEAAPSLQVCQVEGGGFLVVYYAADRMWGRAFTLRRDASQHAERIRSWAKDRGVRWTDATIQ